MAPPAFNLPAGRAAFTVQETAAILGVCRVTVFRLLNSGALRRVRMGRKVLVPASDIADLVERLASTGEVA